MHLIKSNKVILKSKKKVKDMKKVNIKGLGIELQNTKSEKVFKQLFELLKPTVINYYKQYPGNTVEKIEDAYLKSMAMIFNRIDRYDVNKYSISTLVFMKVKHALISKSSNSLKVDAETDRYNTSSALENVLQNNGVDIQDGFESQYQKEDSANKFWQTFKQIIGSDSTYDIFFDAIKNGLDTKELCDKYNVSPQIVANRIFLAKKKIKNYPEIFKQYAYEN